MWTSAHGTNRTELGLRRRHPIATKCPGDSEERQGARGERRRKSRRNSAFWPSSSELDAIHLPAPEKQTMLYKNTLQQLTFSRKKHEKSTNPIQPYAIIRFKT
jgi:hypothetical protein